MQFVDAKPSRLSRLIPLRWRRRPQAWVPGAMVRIALPLADVLATFASYYAAYHLRELGKPIVVAWLYSPWVPAVAAAVLLVAFGRTQGYRDRRFLSGRIDWAEVTRAVGVTFAVLIALAFMAQLSEVQHISRTFIFLFFCILIVTLIYNRWLIQKLRFRLRQGGLDVRRVLVVGTGPSSVAVADWIARHPRSGMHLVGLLGTRRLRPKRAGQDSRTNQSPAVGDALLRAAFFYHDDAASTDPDRLPRALRRLRCDEVVLAWPEADGHTIMKLLAELRRLDVRARVVHPALDGLARSAAQDRVRGLAVIDVNDIPRGELEAQLLSQPTSQT